MDENLLLNRTRASFARMLNIAVNRSRLKTRFSSVVSIHAENHNLRSQPDS
jgi:hypothetical protein